jgi:hypothetical protein
MNEHLAEISRRVSVGAIALLVLDGAGWHSSPRAKGLSLGNRIGRKESAWWQRRNERIHNSEGR